MKKTHKLKQGFILRNPNAKSGEAILHYYISEGFTGCLSLVDKKGDAVVYKHQDFNNEYLLIVDKNGKLKETINLPKNLPWDIIYYQNLDTLFLDIDHFIYQYSFKSKKFKQLTKKFSEPGSFISLKGNKLAYGSYPKVYVKDLDEDNVIYSQECESELYNGHTPQFTGAISKNGDFLALNLRSGEIDLINILSCEKKIIKFGLGYISQLEFTDNDKTLITSEEYSYWGIRFYDLENEKELIYSEIPENEFPTYYCFNQKHTKLAYTSRNKAYIIDYTKKKLLHQFTIEHCIRSAKPQFINELLGVRTDLGYYSLYAL